MPSATKKKCIARFNGVDASLVAEIATFIGRPADKVHQAFPASVDKKSVRTVTVITFDCESEPVANHLAKKLDALVGVEAFVE